MQTEQTAQHTPGAWEAKRDLARNYGFDITSDNGRKIIAETIGGEHEANARLIAAAPDLLDALERLFENCAMVHNRWGDNCNQKEADAAIATARAAIAKAKGGAA